ncbi:ef-hand calcium-binding domain protein [Grosmannia clavigera kw1407]|uniref:Ef-hand calcium-binding domain protein n=1 Tax=Grosmannia clavigera (strain kw1407 / UAMH 11150) TaxID=655863 RepID=F0XEY0_GROCL|nr:ef-hand calcium-binding domain protein [Grosmannia clavigera kw1407]EFX03892.1 ef-hand calcium-binding domain protein [Grosmannia clavigera kw1407]
MRVLCLHGRGTSAAIFKSQTAAMRAKLDSSFVFEFVDGPFRCTPAPGIDTLFDSGTFAWWPQESVMGIRAAHLWLDEYMAAHGPYDALMGFSQGCILIGSYLTSWARDHPQQKPRPPPFRAAIFVCGGMAVSWMEELGLTVSPRARDIDQRSVQSLHRKAGRLRELAANPDLIQRGVGLWDDTTDLVHSPGSLLPQGDHDVFGLDFASFPSVVFIQIPTVHIYGSKDPRLPSSVQLAHFCKIREMYDHGGGHDIPRSSSVSLHIAGMITRLADEIDKQKAQPVATTGT